MTTINWSNGQSDGLKLDTLDHRRVRTFFREVIGTPTVDMPDAIVVTHLLADRPFFIEALAKVANIAAVLPKPKTTNYEIRGWLQHRYPIGDLQRSDFYNAGTALMHVEQMVGKNDFVMLDIGGYFSPVINDIADHFGSRLIGVVEDTENGLQKYESLPELKSAVYHVARSPLKNPEDFLVGQAIVFSVEALLREQGDVIHGRTACVIGYGKLGRSIANLLHARHVRTVVFDKSYVASVEAISHGFPVAETLQGGLVNAGLVFCASGQVSLDAEDYVHLKNGAYVATVTSSDDELQGLSDLSKDYELLHLSEHVSRYRSLDHSFFVLNRGQAVNFVHGAAVGPFIYLVQGEILMSLQQLWKDRPSPGFYECDRTARERIANFWYNGFGQN